MPEVMEFYRMAGDVDYMLRVVVADMSAYDVFYKKLISAVPLKNVTSRFAMEKIKSVTALPVPAAGLGLAADGSGDERNAVTARPAMVAPRRHRDGNDCVIARRRINLSALPTPDVYARLAPSRYCFVMERAKPLQRASGRPGSTRLHC